MCKAIKEIERVSRKSSFITVDAYNNSDEKRMLDWNLTAKTIMSVEEWKVFLIKIIILEIIIGLSLKKLINFYKVAIKYAVLR